MSGWLNHTITNGDLITIFVTWLVCDLIYNIVSRARKRRRNRRKAG